MGVVLSAVRNEAKQQSDEVEKNTNDSLNSLVDMAKLQTALFKTQMKSDTTRINVSKFLREDTVIKCSVDYDAKTIAEHISTVYKSFANQDVAKALGDVLSAGLDALFGSSVANSNEETKYFITVGKLGYPYRVDMHLYTYAFTCSTLTGVTKNVLSVSLMVSSVVLTDLTESDLGAIVQVCYQESDEDTMSKILEKLKEARDKQIEETNRNVSTGIGGHNKAFWDGGAGLGAGRRLLDFNSITRESHDAWKEAMEEEEAIPPYQAPKMKEGLRSVFDKLG
ncbi:hypothetical protein Plec18170_004761 [Paecilomyces lecythidis]